MHLLMTQSYCIKFREIKSRTLPPPSSLPLLFLLFLLLLCISAECIVRPNLAKPKESRWLRGLGWCILSAPLGASEEPWDVTPGMEASRMGSNEATLGQGCVDTAPHLSGTSEQRRGGFKPPSRRSLPTLLQLFLPALCFC